MSPRNKMVTLALSLCCGLLLPIAAPVQAQTTDSVEVGFSPEGSAVALVLKTIRSARSQIRLLGYSFTSAPVTRELIAAKHRGVDVVIVVDYKNNVEDDWSGKARAAMSALQNAGVTVRTVATFPIHHDKSMVVDGLHVETGSFNFSDAAARKNSENVIVLWNQPAVAKIYLQHWASRYALSKPYQEQY